MTVCARFICGSVYVRNLRNFRRVWDAVFIADFGLRNADCLGQGLGPKKTAIRNKNAVFANATSK